MKTYCLLFVAVAAWCTAHAQLQFGAGADFSFYANSDPAVAKGVPGKKLVVVLNEIPEKQVEKLKKKGEYEDTKKRVDEENEKLIAIFKQCWRMDNEVVTKTESEFDEFKKSKDPGYIYFRITQMREQKDKGNPMMGGEVRVTYNYKLLEINELSERKRIAAMSSYGNFVTEIDLKLSLMVLQNLIEQSAQGIVKKDFVEHINERAGVLKQKTLYIPRYLTKLTEAELKSNYPYKVKITDDSEINALIEARDKDAVVVMINHKQGTTGSKFNHLLIDLETFNAVLIDRRSDFGFGSIMGLAQTGGPINFYFPYNINVKDHEFVNKGKLKDYLEVIEGGK